MRDHQVLIPVSRGYPCLGGRLLTCYSPVRHSVPEGTPCDLHVLSTPPAFVLSQNQTLHNIILRNCWTIRIELFLLAHFNSDSAVLPRSEVPKNFISALATARVTTFSFPLFILSGAPPGRLLASELAFRPLSAPRKVILGKLPRPVGEVSVARFPFGQPRSGVRGKAYHNHRFTSSSFLEKSFMILFTPVLTLTFSCGLETKNNFSERRHFCSKKQKPRLFM